MKKCERASAAFPGRTKKLELNRETLRLLENARGATFDPENEPHTTCCYSGLCPTIENCSIGPSCPPDCILA